LTGLANRLAWTEACANVRGTGDSPVAIVVVDAGRLKAINETYGHHVGDDLLRAIADALHGCVRETDTLARLGGDEFAILLEGSDEAETEAVVERLRERVAEKRLPDGAPVTVACGWSIDRAGDLAAAQQRADAQMLAEKRRRSTD
ncbi:MAG: GGDEF domain-containing protein, partial [Actinobacteria bacterium]|nr:GGDEF domain-containing protein [Actinomycetota bacterium]